MTYRKTRLVSLFVILVVVVALLPNVPVPFGVPTAQAAASDPLFKPPLYLNANDFYDTSAVMVGDLNGDGAFDIFLNNDDQPGQKESRIYVNDGQGGFIATEVPPNPADTTTRSVAMGDLDGDGDLDILLGNNGKSQVYLNDGKGNLTPTIAALNSAGNDTMSAAMGDLDGDGDLDILLGNFNQPSQVYLNNGRGGFTPSVTLNPASPTRSVALGDLDGDGDLDILLGNSGRSQVYLNDGRGSFTATVAPLNSTTKNTSSVALGDLNGDGALDILLGNYNQPSQIYVNNGQGSFTAIAASFNPGGNITNSVALGDLDGDGDLDIVLGNERQASQIYVNDGHGIFTATVVPLNPAGSYTRSVALGDLNGDGDLDIFLGNWGQPSQIYLSDEQGIFTNMAPLNPVSSYTMSAALGDLDGDGDLDTVLGNFNQPSQVYVNDGQGNFTPTVALNPAGNATRSVALGDLDGDGDLDILLGNFNQPSQVYLNNGRGGFSPTATSLNPAGSYTWSVALGDLDGDSDLDILLGNNGRSQVYLNDGQGGFPATHALNSLSDFTNSVALGDLNGDGSLDVLLGNRDRPSQVYLNDGLGNFRSTATPLNPVGNTTYSVALGDVDGDGDLDILLGNFNPNASHHDPSLIYLNGGQGKFSLSATPLNPAGSPTYSVALGDLDSDGDLDILLGNGAWSQVYVNDGQGSFTATATTLNPTCNHTNSVAMGDLNGDGTLDIILGNSNCYSPSTGDSSQIYLNHMSTGARLPNTPPVVVVSRPGRTLDAGFYSTPEIQSSQVISIPYTLRDPEGDPVRHVRAEFSLNGGGNWKTAVPATTLTTTLATMPERFPSSPAVPRPIPDLGQITAPMTVTTPTNGTVGTITDIEVELTISHTLVSNLSARLTAPDGTVVPLFAGVGGIGANITGIILDDQAATSIISATAPISGTFRPTGSLAMLNGKNPLGRWTLTVTDGAATNTGSLIAWALRLKTTGVQHTFAWDTFASNFFGHADNVVVRLIAYPSLTTGRNGVPFFQRPFASATTFPFRMRGTQVRVVDGQNTPQPDAIVFRLNETLARDQQLFAPSSTAPAFTTNGSGYLGGRGTLALSDTLIALAPVPLPGAYSTVYSPTVRLYATNMVTTTNGVRGTLVTQSGVQTITVSLNHPLALFDLNVSLEWDARSDTRFMSQLQTDLARASELLFQASHGQAALGSVVIFHDKENWDSADIRIYASNRVRPSAIIGGVATQVITDSTTLSTVVYGPGHVHMGAVWNRFGSGSGNLSEDWPRTLVHELGHYLFFLEDNYLGLDQGKVVPVSSCPGLMGDLYASIWQYQTSAGWSPGCDRTFSSQTTGRADWATIQTFYPALVPPNLPLSTLPSGPIRLPLATTEITSVVPLTPTARLDVPIFYTVDDAGGRVLPALTARAYLFQHGHHTPDASFTQLIPLGRANNDQVLARGARVGDRLCLFEPTAARFGCETITAGRELLAVHSRPEWQPNIQITPVTSRTLDVTVSGVPSGGPGLRAELYPLDNDPQPPTITLIDTGSGRYTGIFTLAYPLPGAYLHLSTTDEPTPTWETVTSYALDGNAGSFTRTGSGTSFTRTGSGTSFTRTGSGTSFTRTGSGTSFIRTGHGTSFARVGGAPVSSAEGDVQLVGATLSFALGQFLLLQTTSSLPPLPPWATLIGQGYRFTTSPNIPDLTGSALSFSYLDAEVPTGEESGIQVYYRSPTATTWTPMTTTLDTYFNMASIPTQGPGLYALMSSVEVPISGPGWSLFAYPVAGQRAVTDALAGIVGKYTAVYGYEPQDTTDHWKLYGPDIPTWANDLSTLTYGHGYWILATEVVTLPLRGATASLMQATRAPPMTLYGVLTTAEGKDLPAPGLPVTARIGGVVCAETTTRAVGDKVGFALDVPTTGERIGCGTPDALVEVTMGGRRIGQVRWTSGPQPLAAGGGSIRVLLPFVQH